MKAWHETWGLNIEVARRRKGWTREQLAAAVGVTMQTISRWERGKLGIRDSQKLILAEVLEEDVRMLFPLVRNGGGK